MVAAMPSAGDHFDILSAQAVGRVALCRVIRGPIMNLLRIEFLQFVGAAAARRVVLALAVAPALISFSTLAAEIELSGTYELINASVKYLDTGEVIPDIYGKNPKGFIMYGTDGRMLAMVTYANRPKPEGIEKTTDDQRIALYKTMYAYGGTYKLKGNTVEHHVDICWDEIRCGTIVERDIEKDGDKLIYTTHPAPFSANGRLAITTLAFRKVK
jgi:lipocalin-like protein